MSLVKFAVIAAMAVSMPAMSFAQGPSATEAKAAEKADKAAAKAAEKEAKAKAKAEEKAKENVDPVTGEPLVCRRMEGVGGNIGGTRICKTKAQWEKMGG